MRDQSAPTFDKSSDEDGVGLGLSVEPPLSPIRWPAEEEADGLVESVVGQNKIRLNCWWGEERYKVRVWLG